MKYFIVIALLCLTTRLNGQINDPYNDDQIYGMLEIAVAQSLDVTLVGTPSPDSDLKLKVSMFVPSPCVDVAYEQYSPDNTDHFVNYYVNVMEESCIANPTKTFALINLGRPIPGMHIITFFGSHGNSHSYQVMVSPTDVKANPDMRLSH